MAGNGGLTACLIFHGGWSVGCEQGWGINRVGCDQGLAVTKGWLCLRVGWDLLFDESECVKYKTDYMTTSELRLVGCILLYGRQTAIHED
jgi:hypothetical protein